MVGLTINVATEDALSEALAVKLLAEVAPRYKIEFSLGKKGASYLKSSLGKFRLLAERAPLLLVTDLDRHNCVVEFVNEWCAGRELPAQFILRVAVRECESWVLADRKAIAARMGLSVDHFPRSPDTILDPKEFLIHLARRSSREVRAELVAERGSLARQGLGYNRFLSEFVQRDWDPLEAAGSSPSLARAIAHVRAICAK